MTILEHQEAAPVKRLEEPLPFQETDTTDQLVYQLVRVEEDGTVIPASEDEVIEVESFLEGDTSLQVSDIELNFRNLIDEENNNRDNTESSVMSGKCEVGFHHLDGLEAERKKLLAELAFLDSLIQKLKDEEKGKGFLSISDIDYSDSKSHIDCLVSTDPDSKLDCRSDTDIMSPDISEGPYRKQIVLMEQTSKHETNNGDIDSPSSTTMKNVSNEKTYDHTQLCHEDNKTENSIDLGSALLKGNVNLDNLSIKKLHEAFRATFGRETSVKDKQWLKRRISMGLALSLEASNSEVDPKRNPTPATIDDTLKISLHEGQGSCLPGQRKGVSNRLHDITVLSNVDRKSSKSAKLPSSPKILDSKFTYHKKPSQKMIHQVSGTSKLDCSEINDPLETFRDEGKRKRKPTKRYIEELAASCTNERNIEKTIANTNESLHLLTDQEITSKTQISKGRRIAISSLGIPEKKVKTGYRRCERPKKGVNKFLSSKSSERAALLIRKAISLHTSRFSGKAMSPEPRVKIKSLPLEPMDVASESKPAPGEDVLSRSHLRLSEALTNTTSRKGRSPKKHHHPWTLREVTKLLEGITHCGVGKWAHIKKFFFSSSIYRSSTDLKDKWRNLVRASNTYHKMLSEQGEHRQKNFSSPVPGSVLLQIYELAASQKDSPPQRGTNRMAGSVLKKHL